MRAIRWALPVGLVTLGFLVFTTASYGTAEYSKQTKKGCTFCHTVVKPADKEAMKKGLTDAGKYFEAHKSLQGYKAK
jgi:hypothetical protein